MIRQRPIELLAPTKNLECGIEAINHGADAVYISILYTSTNQRNCSYSRMPSYA